MDFLRQSPAFIPTPIPAASQESHETLAPTRPRPPSRSAEAPKGSRNPGIRPCVIVGVGASAGGLAAIEQFLAPVPPHGDIAIVIVQHLDPEHESMFGALIQRVTAMPVKAAADEMPVQAGCVYVIPPNTDLSIRNGRLRLLTPAASRGPRLPIDRFLRALADDQQEHAVGVILSGMGSDGTLGLRAIKENGGLVLVQDPGDAQFDSMPKSAIDAGLADIVATASELPERLLAYLRRSQLTAKPIPAPESAGVLQQIIALLRERSGNDFSLYKPNALCRRIARRSALHQIDSTAGYLSFLRENPQELDLLFKELLIGVTSFFRDPAVWEHLKREALPALLATCPSGTTLRAWVPACSSGEEAYSLAITFKEALAHARPGALVALQIYATDLDQDAIAKARQGVYPDNIAADVSPERLAAWFVAEDNFYRVRKEIRQMVTFAPQNIITDPPFTKLDILSCRNLLIYFGPELQKKLLPLFHYALKPAGLLVLGSAETIAGASELFDPLDHKRRIYRRSADRTPRSEVAFPTKVFPAAPGVAQELPAQPPPANLQWLMEQTLLANYAPAAVLVDAEGEILNISGRTGHYLEPAHGKANLNLLAMARAGLREALAGVVKRALRQDGPIHLHGVRVGGDGRRRSRPSDERPRIVDVVVQALAKPEAMRGRVMVVFTEVERRPGDRSARLAPVASQDALAEELQQARAELLIMRDEVQNSHEELKSAYEELQATNEELQSTNEELTTSKEEMESINEELQSVNAELQAKVADLQGVNNDMTNLLNSTEIATVFLDDAFQVRRFTPYANRVFRLIPVDVGRPLSDIVSDLDYPELQDDAREVLRTLVFVEKQVACHDGRWFRVRIMPYRTQDNVIDGVVITLIDISRAKHLEAELRALASERDRP